MLSKVNIKNIFSFLFLLLFFFNVNFKDYFHNHEPDLSEHHECPVSILDYSLNSIIVVDVNFSIEFVSFCEIKNPEFILFYANRKISNHLRSPPIN